jgi:predicted DNA-binding protein (MmcQ/YjbR family)
MNIETIRDYCLAKPEVNESFPFGETTLVFKVFDKVFALMSLEGDNRLNLKCDPARAIELRERYSCVIPGYHMNKQHWNSILLDAVNHEELIFEWIDHSYRLIVNKLPRYQKEQIGGIP